MEITNEGGDILMKSKTKVRQKKPNSKRHIKSPIPISKGALHFKPMERKMPLKTKKLIEKFKEKENV